MLTISIARRCHSWTHHPWASLMKLLKLQLFQQCHWKGRRVYGGSSILPLKEEYYIYTYIYIHTYNTTYNVYLNVYIYMIYVYNCGELFQAFKHLETRSLSCFIGCQVDFSNASSISFHPEGNRSNKTLKGRRMSLGGIWWNDILDGYEAIFHFLRALMGSRHHGAQKCENNSLGL